MINKGHSQLFSVLINVIWKIQHYYKPNIIRCYFYISVIKIGIEECSEKTIIIKIAQRATFLISKQSFNSWIKESLSSISFRRLHEFSWLKILNFDFSETLLCFEIRCIFNTNIFFRERPEKFIQKIWVYRRQEFKILFAKLFFYFLCRL